MSAPLPPRSWPTPWARLGARLLSGLGLLAPAAHAQSAPDTTTGAWPAPLQQALRQSGVPAEAVALLVWPVGAPQPRWQHQADAPRQAASVMKLFTTGVALRQLGPGHVWRTEVGLGGPLQTSGVRDGPLYLGGGGDPSLLIEHVQRMMARWRGAGLRDIRGGIVIDRGLFELPAHDPNAFDGQSLRPYNAGPDALLLNHQSVTLRLMPDAARPRPLDRAPARTLPGRLRRKGVAPAVERRWPRRPRRSPAGGGLAGQWRPGRRAGARRQLAGGPARLADLGLPPAGDRGARYQQVQQQRDGAPAVPEPGGRLEWAIERAEWREWHEWPQRPCWRWPQCPRHPGASPCHRRPPGDRGHGGGHVGLPRRGAGARQRLGPVAPGARLGKVHGAMAAGDVAQPGDAGVHRLAAAQWGGRHHAPLAGRRRPGPHQDRLPPRGGPRGGG